jgi:hypothetical protein
MMRRHLTGNEAAQAKFGLFFELLKELSEKGLNQIRMSDNFKNYSILKDVNLSS